MRYHNARYKYLLVIGMANSYLYLYTHLAREERLRFIREKYVYRAWAAQTCCDEAERLSEVEHAVNNGHLQNLLQAFAEGADLAAPLPCSVSN